MKIDVYYCLPIQVNCKEANQKELLFMRIAQIMFVLVFCSCKIVETDNSTIIQHHTPSTYLNDTIHLGDIDDSFNLLRPLLCDDPYSDSIYFKYVTIKFLNGQKPKRLNFFAVDSIFDDSTGGYMIRERTDYFHFIYLDSMPDSGRVISHYNLDRDTILVKKIIAGSEDAHSGIIFDSFTAKVQITYGSNFVHSFYIKQ
jgi:hypothetical protein